MENTLIDFCHKISPIASRYPFNFDGIHDWKFYPFAELSPYLNIIKFWLNLSSSFRELFNVYFVIKCHILLSFIYISAMKFRRKNLSVSRVESVFQSHKFMNKLVE